jgi:uncharacterized membrane protein YfhO
MQKNFIFLPLAAAVLFFAMTWVRFRTVHILLIFCGILIRDKFSSYRNCLVRDKTESGLHNWPMILANRRL